MVNLCISGFDSFQFQDKLHRIQPNATTEQVNNLKKVFSLNFLIGAKKQEKMIP